MEIVQHSTRASLTPREKEVACLLSKGLLHKQVARELGITSGTVGVHAKAAASKLPGDGRPSVKIARYFSLFQAST